MHCQQLTPLPGGGSYCNGGSGVTVGLGGSQIGISYQLYNGTGAAGSPIAGTGSSISFGLQTAAGTYSVMATNSTTGCTKLMSGTVNVGINLLPTVYNISSGGSYCAGSGGIDLTTDGSQSGVTYQLFNGSAPVISIAGTGYRRPGLWKSNYSGYLLGCCYR